MSTEITVRDGIGVGAVTNPRARRRRIRPYARWSRLKDATRYPFPPPSGDFPNIDFGALMLEAELLDFVRNNGLKIVGGPDRIERRSEDAPPGVAPPLAEDESIILVEVRAAGLLPEERLPRGWRAIFMAP